MTVGACEAVGEGADISVGVGRIVRDGIGIGVRLGTTVGEGVGTDGVALGVSPEFEVRSGLAARVATSEAGGEIEAAGWSDLMKELQATSSTDSIVKPDPKRLTTINLPTSCIINYLLYG